MDQSSHMYLGQDSPGKFDSPNQNVRRGFSIELQQTSKGLELKRDLFKIDNDTNQIDDIDSNLDRNDYNISRRSFEDIDLELKEYSVNQDKDKSKKVNVYQSAI